MSGSQKIMPLLTVTAVMAFLFGAFAAVGIAQVTIIEPGAYYDEKYATSTMSYEQQEQTERINSNFEMLHQDNLNIIRILNDIKYSRQ